MGYVSNEFREFNFWIIISNNKLFKNFQSVICKILETGMLGIAQIAQF